MTTDDSHPDNDSGHETEESVFEQAKRRPFTTSVDPHRGDTVASRLSNVMHAVEPALESDEIEAIEAAIAFIEDAANIEHGEREMVSELTGTTYRVTKWAELREGGALALQKEAVESGGEE